ncbi:MAG: biotin transport system substrate-specific component [Methanobacteriaceae archaeon]|nr:biotin transport system substrate-specific component [Methanobacteriaceae archaeon]
MNLESYYKKRYMLFKWRSSQSFVNKSIMAFFMACLTGLMAQIVIPLPWTPVPVTAQTFAVLISGIVLGRYWGGFSQLLYVILGVAGIPWFAGMESGYTIILGATGGYLIGFIIAALFLGHFVDKYVGSRNFIPMFALMLFANFILIYVPGLLALGFWVYTTKGYIPSLWNLLVMGLLPFIIGDIIKITGASALTKAITPKEAYGEEVDTKD